MKSIPSALQAHYDTGSTTVSHAMIIARPDGALYGFTSNDKSFTMDVTSWGFSSSALVFDAKQGLDASTIVTTIGLNVDNMELTTLDDGSLFNRDQILGGLWRMSRFLIFRYRWDIASPTVANDCEALLGGWFGEVTLNVNTIKIELRGLAQLLQQPVGIVSTKTCRSRLGAVGTGQCNKDLTGFSRSLTVTTFTDKQNFVASADTQVADYYGEGIVTWLTGQNAGLSQKVRTSAAGGSFTLVLPMVLPVAIGDTFTALAGCRKRLTEDCKTKFNNAINFQGEPHRPLTDALLKRATANA